jgi:hypothetical protein
MYWQCDGSWKDVTPTNTVVSYSHLHTNDLNVGFSSLAGLKVTFQRNSPPYSIQYRVQSTVPVFIEKRVANDVAFTQITYRYILVYVVL